MSTMFCAARCFLGIAVGRPFLDGAKIKPAGVKIRSIRSAYDQAVPSGFCMGFIKKFFRTVTSLGEMFINLTPVW